MIQLQVYRQLEGVAQRYRRLWFRRALALGFLGAALVGGLILLFAQSRNFDTSLAVALLIVLAVAAVVFSYWWSRRLAANDQNIARRVEKHFPDLEARLLAAMEQDPDKPDGRFGYLQTSLIRETLLHARKKKWRGAVSDSSSWLICWSSSSCARK